MDISKVLLDSIKQDCGKIDALIEDCKQALKELEGKEDG